MCCSSVSSELGLQTNPIATEWLRRDGTYTKPKRTPFEFEHKTKRTKMCNSELHIIKCLSNRTEMKLKINIDTSLGYSLAVSFKNYLFFILFGGPRQVTFLLKRHKIWITNGVTVGWAYVYSKCSMMLSQTMHTLECNETEEKKKQMTQRSVISIRY